ncbi:diphthamide synthesis protein [Candidatus Woesearchaeota archaeon]|nr:diphthamide synthesis protein [Candidatus Woesearchaeota archaeon]
MDAMMIEARYSGKSISLSPKVIEHIKTKGYKKVALYASVQFTQVLEEVIKQVESLGAEVISSKPMRTSERYQLLGCISYKSALRLEEEPDAFLYIGDGAFHPRALVLAQKDEESFKEIIRYDPITGSMSIMGREDCDKIFKKYQASLAKILMSKEIGVIITLKPGQQQFKVSRKLRELFPDKNFYFFATEQLDMSQAEDFNFIEAWINTACPRIGFDDAAEMNVAMANLTDVLKLSTQPTKK